MSIKRYTGAAFAGVATRKRYSGSAWVALTFGKRWNGAGWVDLWSESQNGNAGASDEVPVTPTSGSGTIAKITSTVSRPPVNYSGSYAYQKSGAALSLKVKFAAWISSSATLGNGIQLTVFARINGGTWKSAVIKSNDAVWKNSSNQHYATINLSGTEKTNNTIEWYVTRSGSRYGGSAGNLGTAKSPIKQTIRIS